MKKIMSIAITVFLLSLICTSYAGATYAEPDLPNHNTFEWQKLGSVGNANDGVSWSINGGTFTPWGDRTLNLKEGDKVEFKFTVNRANYGKHPYDDLGVWLYNGSNDTWESILFERMDKTESWGSGSGQIMDNRQIDKKYESKDFFSSEITIGSSFGTDIWLRARVSCSESINGVQGVFDTNKDSDTYGDFLYNKNKNGKLKKEDWDWGGHIRATGDLRQGEIEQYHIRVAPVPIPGAVWLLGSGLLGLIGVRRKKS